MKKKVLIVTNLLSPYRVLFFNALSSECDLTVAFECEKALDRNNMWKESCNDNFKKIYLGGLRISNDSRFSLKLSRIIKKEHFDFIIFFNFTSITGIAGIHYCVKHKIKYGIEADGAFVAQNESKFKKILKTYVVSNASFCFSTCANLDEYFRKYGAKGKILRYHFSSLTQNDLEKNRNLKKDRSLIRKKYTFSNENKIVLSVGQFIYRKGFDLLLKISKKHPEITFLIVGGKPTVEYYQIIGNSKNIIFIDFNSKEKLMELYALCDYFVLPTREDIWGLVVNEAMSFGIPILTTNRCNAGLEMVSDGLNGYICKANSEFDLEDKFTKLISSKTFDESYSFEVSSRYSIESMVRGHVDYFNSYEKENRNN